LEFKTTLEDYKGWFLPLLLNNFRHFGKIPTLNVFGHFEKFMMPNHFGHIIKVEKSLHLGPNIMGTLDKSLCLKFFC